MPVDIYYAPKENASPVTLTEVKERFVAAGVVCNVEPDPDAPDLVWFEFEPRSTTTICASIKSDYVVFVTVHASFDDDLAFGEQMDNLLESLGFSAGDEI